MPHANIWIRREDWDKWQAIEKKAEYISQALNSGFAVKAGDKLFVTNGKDPIKRYDATTEKTYEPLAEPQKSKITKTHVSIPGVSLGFCPHGFAKGNCKKDDCNKKYR